MGNIHGNLSRYFKNGIFQKFDTANRRLAVIFPQHGTDMLIRILDTRSLR